jgi:hypothetical protein
MTHEQQRIAIAEVRGWTKIWKGSENIYGINNDLHTCIPHYPSDLNAMHEAVMSRTLDERQLMTLELKRMIGFSKMRTEDFCVNATAAQRAEAFLRALNLWT